MRKKGYLPIRKQIAKVTVLGRAIESGEEEWGSGAHGRI